MNYQVVALVGASGLEPLTATGDWKPGSGNKVQVPQEPATKPVYAHVPWPTPTLPWVTVAAISLLQMQARER